MAYTFPELKSKPLAELREIAAGIEHEAVKGYTQLNKDHLLAALCKALIIGVLSNRLGRAVDRSRTLEDRLRQLQPAGQKAARQELDVLSRRVRLVYGSIVLSVICALFVGLLIAVAFVDAFIDIDLSKFI